MLINGEWLIDTPTFPVFNPATGEEIGRVADGTEQDAARAIDAARAALPAWMNETAYARSAVLYRAYQLMLEQQRELAELKKPSGFTERPFRQRDQTSVFWCKSRLSAWSPR